MKKGDEFTRIAEYLHDLNMSSQKLRNTNYYNSLSRFKLMENISENPILRCLRMGKDEEEQFRSIDYESHSMSAQSGSDPSDWLPNEEGEGFQDEHENRENRGKKQTEHSSQKGGDNGIVFSFDEIESDKRGGKNSRYSNKCRVLVAQKGEEAFGKLVKQMKKDKLEKGAKKENGVKGTNREGLGGREEMFSPKHSVDCDAKKKQTRLFVGMGTSDYHIPRKCRTSSQGNHENNTHGNSQRCNSFSPKGKTEQGRNFCRSFKMKKGDNVRYPIYEQGKENANEGQDIYTHQGILERNNLEVEDTPGEDAERNKFSSQREEELFRYLIVQANKEVEKISTKLEQRYKSELICRGENLKNEYEKKIKELLKNKTYLCVENETMAEKNKNSKEEIKKLEKAKYALLNQIEELQKNNEVMNDTFFRKEIFKNKNDIKIKKLNDKIKFSNKQIEDYEKKISELNDDLNRSCEKYYYFQNKWSASELGLRHKEAENENLKKELEKYRVEKNESEERLKRLKREHMKVERENDHLRDELNKTKLYAAKLKEKNEQEHQNGEQLLSCYKMEEKKLKEDLENYKRKCALLENEKGSKVLEEKCKRLENMLEDTENERCIYERTCVKNENVQKDMTLEIKCLKNELYECKTKLYRMNKSGVNNPKVDLFNISKDDYVMKENGMENKKEELQSLKEDTEQKISSIEKQLILLKLEKTNRESELIRRTEEIKKKKFLEGKLKYLDEKINILNKSLKLIRLHGSSTGGVV
ncbi:conserved Plasmodium protein, unknown function [Plasmodium ovale]|uniref:Uncharacterized protein n=1 Tax=Plasmodium ovale TaxID=36330 RepID=A0A1D3TGW3_PLAOA|nr:conserved Plasmodium protein, unknown function [Plasmodium ovale]